MIPESLTFEELPNSEGTSLDVALAELSYPAAASIVQVVEGLNPSEIKFENGVHRQGINPDRGVWPEMGSGLVIERFQGDSEKIVISPTNMDVDIRPENPHIKFEKRNGKGSGKKGIIKEPTELKPGDLVFIENAELGRTIRVKLEPTGSKGVEN